MIVYQNSSLGFLEDVDTNCITDRIKDAFLAKTGKVKFADSESMSWTNSMEFMAKIVRRSRIADDCGVMIEFGLPSTSKRIDFVIAGRDESDRKNFVIVELKQWTTAESTDKSDLVLTKYYGGAYSAHPSYQATTYRCFLSDYNENVYKNKLLVHSCAYLHNFTERKPEPLKESIYDQSLKDSPLYFKDDHAKLESFIRDHVGFGKGAEILYEIESGSIRPSKKLIDYVGSMFKGNQEFYLLDEQKVAYEIAMNAALTAKRKSVMIIKGGPGTGKSVISVSLLGGLLHARKNVIFVAPNASFREVMLEKLTKGKDKVRASHLFKGSSAFVDLKPNTYEVVVVDEAHRLKNETAYMYKGKNQVDDIIKASRVSIFFVDEDQMIRPEDIGSRSEIEQVARKYGADVQELPLTSQFRCSGAEGYINWINDVLGIRETANYDGWDKQDFEFELCDDPNSLRDIIYAKQDQNYSARMLAGYAWIWSSAKQGNSHSQVADVRIEEYGFAMPWNSRQVGTTWATHESGVSQIGCVHTSQGLEFDYVGVIIGDDLRYDPVKKCLYSRWNDYKDINGKKGMKDDPDALNKLIRNVYRILLTRGMKGCFLYCTDPELQKYFKQRLAITQAL